jgi:dihydrolipoamide dehydrogenase
MTRESSAAIAVIGAGPGGYAAAFFAADLGVSVALIDEAPNPGGVCLYRGCIPSKALLHVARVIAEAAHARAWGVEFGPPLIDLDKLRGWKDSVVRKLTGGLGQLSRQRAVEYIQGRASLIDAHTLAVETPGDGTRRVRFEHAILATGSRPARLPGLTLDSPRVFDSTAALALPFVPKTMLVVGGGYIGLELGTVYAALGTKITIVEMMPGLLPGVDRDLVGVLARRVEQIAEAVWLNTKVARLEERADGILVAVEGAETREQVFEAVLVAVGRTPNSELPGLERTKVERDARGFIRVDAQRRTAEPSLFAIGDVAGEPMLAHKAAHEGRLAVEAALGRNVAWEPRAIPAVVFTDPEVAWCGLTETEAAATGRKVAVARFPWGASGRAATLDRTDGLTKLVIDPDTERIVGVGLVGPGAGELIAEGVVAVEMGALASDLKLAIHPHPTLSETLMEAAEVFFGQSTHYATKKKRA